MIKWFTEKYNYEVVALNSSLNNYSVPGIGIPEARRFYPHISPGEGQFVCLLKNNNDVVERNCFISHKLNNLCRILGSVVFIKIYEIGK